MSAQPESFRTDSRIESLRVPPQSVEAEQAVIGGIMLSPQAYLKIADLLNEADFYRRDHRLMYRAIVELAKKNKPFDVVTLGEWFEANCLVEQIGGTGYLIELASTTPSAANIKAYAEIVAEKAMMRRLIETGTEIVNAGFEPAGRKAMDVLGAAQQRLGAVLQSQPSELETTGTVLRRMIEKASRRHELDGKPDGLSVGYPELDRLLCGLKPGQLVILGGRPKMGKTTLAMNIAEAVAIEQGKRVAVHSLEMQPEDLLERMCCSVGRVSHDAVRRWDLGEAEANGFYVASGKVKSANILLSQPRNVRIEQLIAQTMRAHAETPLDLVVIDYLQLIDVSGAERKDIGVGEVTRQLKLMAQSGGFPVILLSQLNRGLEQRTDKRPAPADLRDSGSIEQDADIVLFVYRDEVYHSKSLDRGTTEVIIALHRAGPTGMVRLQSRLDICRFDTLADDWQPMAATEGQTPGKRRWGKSSSSGRDAAAGGDD